MADGAQAFGRAFRDNRPQYRQLPESLERSRLAMPQLAP
jgi:hypothetical protein